MTEINNLHKSFFDAIDEPIFIKNRQGVYIYCNDAFVRIMGVPRNKLLGSTAFDITTAKLAQIYVEADQDLFGSKQLQQYSSAISNAQSKELVPVMFNKAIFYNPDNTIGGFIGSIRIRRSLELPRQTPIPELTKREQEVLNLLQQGLSTKMIARSLAISPHTTNSYLKKIYQKLGVHSSNEAILKSLALFGSSSIIC